MRINLGLTAVLLAFLIIPLSYADGFFFPRDGPYHNEDIFDPTQKAAIFFDGSTENLIIQAGYQGKSSDFAWVIPVPSYPDVNKSDSYLFEDLHSLTMPKEIRFPSITRYTAQFSEAMKDVNVYEQKQVGLYAVTILSSEDPAALVDWLNENEYSVPAEAVPVIDYYVQKGWYFIALRINLAPYDEALISSLKQVDQKITSQEDAVTILTEDIVRSIKEEKHFEDAGKISVITPDYGGDDGQIAGNGRYYSRPQGYVIDPRSYKELKEKYNGYFEEDMIYLLEDRLHRKLENEMSIPSPESCYKGSVVDNERCSIWYFSKESDEYNLLKDVKCGKYCSLISPEKEQYSMDDLATVATYAILEEKEESVSNYFKIQAWQGEWYDTEDDKFKRVKTDVLLFLQNEPNSKRDELYNRLGNELLSKYSGMTGQRFNYLGDIAHFFAEKIISEFKNDVDFGSSYIKGIGIMTSEEYYSYKSIYEGDGDEAYLREQVGKAVREVVYWKQDLVQTQLESRTIQPVSIRFQSSIIVYPMKISSLNKGSTEVLLYVFADHKVKVQGVDGFEVEYARWVNPGDLKTNFYYSYLDYISRQDQNSKVSGYGYYDSGAHYYLNKFVDRAYYLTKLRNEMTSEDMTDDLTIVRAEDDKAYRLTIWQKGYFLRWGLLITWFVIWTGLMWLFWAIFALLNNKVIRQDESSSFYMTRKRCFYYALVLPSITLLRYLSSHIRGAYESIHRFMQSNDGPFDFMSHLLHRMHFPSILSDLVILAMCCVVIILGIHLIGSLIVKIKKILSSHRL